MTYGTKLQTRVTRFINKLGSDITINTRTVTSNSNGYSADTITTDSTATVKALSTSNLSIIRENYQIGNVTGGDIRISVPYDTTITKDDTVTFQGYTYTIDDIDDHKIQDTVLCRLITMTRDIDDNN